MRKINEGVFIGCSLVVLQSLEVIRSEYLSGLHFRSFAMLILWAWCCLCFTVMCYSSSTLEQGKERGICILSMQCLQISHPGIIISAVRGGGCAYSGTTNSTYSLWKLKSIISQSYQPCFYTLLCFFWGDNVSLWDKHRPFLRSQGKEKLLYGLFFLCRDKICI